MIDFSESGRMIADSKGLYLTKFPNHVCVFNANVCVKSRGKIWFGDLDLTEDANELKRLAAELGETVYVLREKDARFRNEKNPQYEAAVAQYEP